MCDCLNCVQYCNIPLFLIREINQPSSSIYKHRETGDELAEALTSGDVDLSKPSGRAREVRQYGRHLPARGLLPIRSLGGYKAHEDTYMKG